MNELVLKLNEEEKEGNLLVELHWQQKKQNRGRTTVAEEI
jgi:hypothetical protein